MLKFRSGPSTSNFQSTETRQFRRIVPLTRKISVPVYFFPTSVLVSGITSLAEKRTDGHYDSSSDVGTKFSEVSLYKRTIFLTPLFIGHAFWRKSVAPTDKYSASVYTCTYIRTHTQRRP